MEQFDSTHRRLVKTYAETWRAARIILEQSRQTTEGVYFLHIAVGLLLASTVEAFLNHVLQAELKPAVWTLAERAGVGKKLDSVLEITDTHRQLSNRDRRILRELATFRNALMHGKTDELTKNEVIKAEHAEAALAQANAPTLAWEGLPKDRESLQVTYDCVERLVRTVGLAAGMEEMDLFQSGAGVHVLTPRS